MNLKSAYNFKLGQFGKNSSPGADIWNDTASVAMSGIFINYRRDDAGGVAGRLYDYLTTKISRRDIFMDVDAMRPGMDFVTQLDASLSQCHVLLAMIGPHWLDAKDRNGRRRLDNNSDFVRVELSSALKRDIPVIPILIDGAEMPSEESLPVELKSLARRHALELRHTRFNADANTIVHVLEKLSPHHPVPWRLIGGGVAVAAIVLIATSFWLNGMVRFGHEEPSILLEKAAPIPAVTAPSKMPPPIVAFGAQPNVRPNQAPAQITPPAAPPSETRANAAPSQDTPSTNTRPGLLPAVVPPRPPPAIIQSRTPPAPTTVSIEGLWNGTYVNGQKSVPFTFTFDPSGCSGRSEEPNTFGNRSAPKLFANLTCSTSALSAGQTITIVKTYDGTGGVSHSVMYIGSLSADLSQISGQWMIGSNASGPFSMQR